MNKGKVLKPVYKAAIAVVLSLVIIYLIGMTVHSTENVLSAGRSDEYTKELEREYVKSIKAVLSKQGIGNAGVMLTKITCEDGKREYSLRINHRLLDKNRNPEKYDRVLSEIKSVNDESFRNITSDIQIYAGKG